MASKFIDKEEKNELEKGISYDADDKPLADNKDGNKPVCGDGVHNVYLLMFVMFV